jgi:hypothetical protein
MSRPGIDAQAAYARWLETGTRITLAIAIVALVLYLSGALRSLVPLDALPTLWQLPAAELVSRGQALGGWQWLAFLNRGEGLAIAAMALFCLLSLVCCARAFVAFHRRGERMHAMIAAAQVAVLAAAMLWAH